MLSTVTVAPLGMRVTTVAEETGCVRRFREFSAITMAVASSVSGQLGSSGWLGSSVDSSENCRNSFMQ